MLKFQSDGFTLIEILVVVVIVAILTVMGVQMISSGSVERNLQQHGRILQATMNYACDQATLQNIPYGVKFNQNSYAFSLFVNQQWQDVVSDNATFNKEFTDGSVFQLEIDGQSVVLSEEFAEVPSIVCDSSGELSDFKLIITDVTQKHRYLLKRVDFWKIEGEWLDEKQKS